MHNVTVENLPVRSNRKRMHSKHLCITSSANQLQDFNFFFFFLSDPQTVKRMHPNDLYAYLFYTSTISFPFFYIYKYIYIYFCNHDTGFYHYYFKFSPLLQDANLNLCCRYTVFFFFFLFFFLFFFQTHAPKAPQLPV